MNTKTIFIHFGNTKFNKERFVIPKNRNFGNKPIGGLWASPENADFGWKEWNDVEHYVECDPDNAFRFKLKKGTRLYEIHSKKDADMLPVVENNMALLYLGIGMDTYDWEAIAKECDAVMYYEHSKCMYGWECDSILVLNPDVIIPLK